MVGASNARRSMLLNAHAQMNAHLAGCIATASGPYTPEGHLVTDPRSEDSGDDMLWDETTDWEANQEKQNIEIGTDLFRLEPIEFGSVFFADDWADNMLESDRASFEDPGWQGQDSTLLDVGDTDSSERPAWQVDDGSPSVSGEMLNITQGDAISKAQQIDELDHTTWEFRIEDASFGWAYVTLSAQDRTYREGDRNLINGYYVTPTSSDTIDLYVDNGGTRDAFITSGTVNPPVVVRVERHQDGNWELYIDGNLEGQGTNQDFNTGSYVSVSSRTDSTGEFIDLDWFLIDDADEEDAPEGDYTWETTMYDLDGESEHNSNTFEVGTE